MDENCVLRNSLHLSHEMIKKVVKPGDVVIDATAGNGHDTAFLSALVGKEGKVYSFDIQEKAIQNTANRISKLDTSENVILIHDGHQNMDKYVKEAGNVRAVMFNLGYLPSGDHSIATRPETTIEAIEKSLKLITLNGIVSIVVYYGGDSGFDEKEKVLQYIRTLDCHIYTVLESQFVNQPNCPPIFVCIEKYAQSKV